MLFERNIPVSNSNRISAYDELSECFLNFSFRGTCLSLDEFNDLHNFNFEKDPADFKIDDLISLCEYMENLLLAYQCIPLSFPYGYGNTRPQLINVQFYLQQIGQVMEKMGLTKNDLGLRIGAFGAEPWTENMRKEIEERLGLKGYNIYGLSEIMGPGVSYECQEQNGSHINEDHFFPEIIDPNTLQPLPYGQQGELVFTTLTKEGMPLLRYRTKDLTSLIDTPCPCGRTSVRMTPIMGRSDDMLIIRGINVFPSQVESVILEMKEFEPQYLLIVDRKGNLDTLEIQVEVRRDFFSDDIGAMLALKKSLADKLKSVLSISADVKLVEPNSIARSQGKSKRVIDNRKLV